MKKDVYELALFKIKQEETAVELMLKEKNMNKRKLEEILEKEIENFKKARQVMEEEKTISPSIILLSKQMSEEERQRINAGIRRLESEMLALRKEYLRIKTKKEKVMEEKERKGKEEETANTLKENQQIYSDYMAKKVMEDRVELARAEKILLEKKRLARELADKEGGNSEY